MLLRLLEALRRFDGQIQPQLILLQKTLLNVEGLGRQLYPELNIWQTATPVLRQWMRQRISPLRLLRDLRAQLPDVLDALRAAPSMAKRLVAQVEKGELHVPVDNTALEALRAEVRAAGRRRDWLMVAGFVLLAAAVFFSSY